MRWHNSLSVASLLVLAACAGHRERPAIARAPVAHAPVSDTPVRIGAPYQVAGRWYVPADTRDYDEVGLASWYGPGFDRGSTANGERFDAAAVSAAHKTLPLPSYVEVTALATGRTILVRVNDRGPFVADRIIDLSRGAARQLGVERLGVVRVRVRRVDPPEADRLALRRGLPALPRPDASPTMLANLNAHFVARPASAPALARAVPPTVTPSPASLDAIMASLEAPPATFVEVPAGTIPSTNALADRLRAFGPVAAGGAEGGTVRLGPFADDPSASAVLAQLRARGYAGAHLVHAPGPVTQTAGTPTDPTP